MKKNKLTKKKEKVFQKNYNKRSFIVHTFVSFLKFCKIIYNLTKAFKDSTFRILRAAGSNSFSGVDCPLSKNASSIGSFLMVVVRLPSWSGVEERCFSSYSRSSQLTQCVWQWRFRWYFLLKNFKQILHWNCFSLPQSDRRCRSIPCRVGYHFPQLFSQ